MWYLDTSAAIKLLFDEPGSKALRGWVMENASELVSSDLLRTELMRASARIDPDKLEDAQTIVRGLFIMRLSTAAYRRAGDLAPAVLASATRDHLAG